MLLKKTFKIFSHQNRMKNDEKCDQSTVMLSLEIIKSWNAVIVSKWSPSPPMQCKLHYNISRRKHIIAFFSWNAAKISSSRQLFYTHTHTHVFTSSTGRDGARTAAAAGLPAPCGLRLLEPRPGHGGHLCQARHQVNSEDSRRVQTKPKTSSCKLCNTLISTCYEAFLETMCYF